MSNVGGVSNVGSVQGGYQVTGGQISPDSIMAYCSAQMSFLDAGIQERMAQQQASRDVQALLGDVKAALMKHALGGDDWGDKQQVIQAMEAAWEKMAPNDPMRDQLNDRFHDFTATCINSNNIDQANGYNLGHLDEGTMNQFQTWCADNNGNNAADLTELKQLSDNVDTLVNDCGKGAELQMINLQSMVSQRQMAIQLTTQIISKMNDAQMAVVGQIGK
jgi:hypothetical protein